jgi:hypothetical protein
MNKLKLNKKGFLLGEETLKIIVAVICLLFLIYLVVAVYNSNTSAKKVEEAKEILSRIKTISLALNNGENERQDISNPEGWHVYTFIEQKKPNSCINEKCLCICDNILVNSLGSQEKKCDEKGTCLSISNLATSNLDLKITGAEPLLIIEIKNQNGEILIGEAR